MPDSRTGRARDATPQGVVEARPRERDLSPRVRERLEMVKADLLGQDLATIRPGLGARRARCAGGWRGLPAGVWRIWPMPRGADARPRRMPGIWRRWSRP